MTTGQSVALPNFSTGMIIERGVNGTAYNYLKYQNTIRFFVFWGKKYGSAHINRAGTIKVRKGVCDPRNVGWQTGHEL